MVHPFGVRALSGATEPEVPFQRLRNWRGLRQEAAPARDSLSRRVEVHALHWPERFRAQHLDDLAVRCVGVVLRAHLRDDAGLGRDVAEKLRLDHRLRHRLLEVDVLTRLHRCRSHGDMVVVRRPDADGVAGIKLLFVHLAPVAVESRLRELGLRLREELRVYIAKRRHLDGRMGAEFVDVAPGAVAAADGEMAHARIRAARRGNGGESLAAACGE